MRLKILSFMVVFTFLFFGCDSDNSENDTEGNDIDTVENNDEDVADSSDDNENPDTDEETSCCRIINTVIASNDSGMYVAGHTRDKEHAGGCEYIGFIKKHVNGNWKNVYEAGDGFGGGPALTIQSVWVGNSDEVAVVGVDGPLFFVDDEWRKIFNGELTINSIQYGVWGTSLMDIFAIGGDDSPRVGAIFHFDGSEWIRMEIPTENELRGVWGTASDDVYSVGENGTILHYDGNKWTEMESGTTEYLSGVWGSGKQDIYVTGENVILHFNGDKWIETLKDEKSFFLGVHGLASDSILAVGRTIAETPEAVVFHYNGQKWNKIETNIKSILFDVLAMPDGSFYVVGDNNTIERITP